MKHIREDLHQEGTEDHEVVEVARFLGRIVVTRNGRHFRKLVDAGSPGVIDIPAGWPHSQVDSKLTALLTRHGPKYFAGHYRTLASE